MRNTHNSYIICKKCKRLLADNKPAKSYEVTFNGYDGRETKIVNAPTASKAIYKAFKKFYYNDDYDIGEEFLQFRKYGKLKAKKINDKDEDLSGEEVKTKQV